ncbi:unnamed protein product, partial [Rotaria sp. Silwood2]
MTICKVTCPHPNVLPVMIEFLQSKSVIKSSPMENDFG